MTLKIADPSALPLLHEQPMPMPDDRYPLPAHCARELWWFIETGHWVSSGELPPGRAERMPRVNLLTTKGRRSYEGVR